MLISKGNQLIYGFVSLFFIQYKILKCDFCYYFYLYDLLYLLKYICLIIFYFCDKVNLIIMDDFFDICFYLIFKYFIKYYLIYVYEYVYESMYVYV